MSRELCNYLIENRIDTITVVGLDAAACVSKTGKRGFHVSVLQDCVMSKKAGTTDRALKWMNKCSVILLHSPP